MAKLKHRPLPPFTQKQIDRFWAGVDMSPGQGPFGTCWEWKRGRFPSGYGVFSINSRYRGIRTHRIAYFLSRNEDPGDFLVRHIICDNPPCCRPDHVEKGTNADNSNDCVSRGRQAKGDSSPSRLHMEKRPRGEGHYKCKIPTSALAGIKARWTGKYGEQAAMAREFGVSATAIGAIIHGRSRRHG